MKYLRIAFRICLGLFVFSVAWVLVYRFVPVPVTYLMLSRVVEQATTEGKTVRMSHDWVSASDMSSNMAFAVMMTEDQTFTTHYGFNLDAIEKALKNNAKRKKRGKPIRGGSTISQQTAKNVFLWPERSWVRKGLEAYFTLLIETLWSKERIMEVYLNSIEMGDGIYGIQAASQAYFHKDASRLTRDECALIAACLPNPRKYSPVRPSGYVQKVKSFAISQMTMWGGVSPLMIGKK